MENYKVRKVIESIDSLIDISIPDEDRKQELKKSIGHYKSLMLILRKKGENYTEEELKKFQEHSFIFFQTWIILYRRHGITNYIHMIGVGHMLGYMKKYENLNKYSQQGWEALNALINFFSFAEQIKVVSIVEEDSQA